MTTPVVELIRDSMPEVTDIIGTVLFSIVKLLRKSEIREMPYPALTMGRARDKMEIAEP